MTQAIIRITVPDFDPMRPQESLLLELDAVNHLPAGVEISSMVVAAWTATVVRGTDASASSRIVGTALYGGTATQQRVSGCVAGVRYFLEATFLATNGDTVAIGSHVDGVGVY